MILRPVLIEIPPLDGLSGAERVQRQREFARRALRRCAALAGVPDGPWPKGPDEAPLACNGVYWSVSHKPGCAGAVIADGPVGIDVECLRPRGDDLSQSVADNDEWRIVGGRSWPAFFRVWTAKEATLKACGVGIGELRDCRVMDSPDSNHLLLAFRGREWTIEHFTLGEHLAAVTLVGPGADWHVVDAVSALRFDRQDTSPTIRP